jgi:formate dehydrogenase major subunit
MRPLKVGGRTIHQIGLPYHWASKGLVRGDSTNELTGFVADPNVSIQESKAFTASIEPGRKSKNRRSITSRLLPRPIAPDMKARDLPEARHKPQGKHGFKALETKEGHV